MIRLKINFQYLNQKKQCPPETLLRFFSRLTGGSARTTIEDESVSGSGAYRNLYTLSSHHYPPILSSVRAHTGHQHRSNPTRASSRHQVRVVVKTEIRFQQQVVHESRSRNMPIPVPADTVERGSVQSVEIESESV